MMFHLYKGEQCNSFLAWQSYTKLMVSWHASMLWHAHLIDLSGVMLTVLTGELETNVTFYIA